MDYQTLHMKTVIELRKLARELGVQVPAGTLKSRLVELVLEGQQRAAGQGGDAGETRPRTENAPSRRGRRRASAEASAAPAAKRRQKTCPGWALSRIQERTLGRKSRRPGPKKTDKSGLAERKRVLLPQTNSPNPLPQPPIQRAFPSLCKRLKSRCAEYEYLYKCK